MEPNYSTILVDNIMRRLEELGIKQVALAEKLKIKRSGVTKLLKNRNPKLAKIVELAEALNIRPWQLLQPSDDKNTIEALFGPSVIHRILQLTETQKDQLRTAVRIVLEMAEQNKKKVAKSG